MESVVEVPETSWDSRRRQAGALACRGDSSAARTQLWRLTQDASSPRERAAIISDLAAIAAATGQRVAAQCGFRRALRLHPQQTATKQNLSRLNIPIGNASSDADISIRPRIAILSLLFNWPSTGGGTVHTKELADALQGDGYDVRHIYAVYEPWGLGRVTEPLSVPTVPLVFDDDSWTAETFKTDSERPSMSLHPTP